MLDQLSPVSGRPWRERPADPDLVAALVQRKGLADVVARVLAGRGIGLDEVDRFLEPRLRDFLVDPSHLADMDKAAARLVQAVRDREPVGIIGDYDVDGATSAALLSRWLRGLGVPVEIEIPDRLLDGYGPNPGALDRLRLAGCRLVASLDSGTTAFEPLAHAALHGQEVIVVDHHAAEAELPRAFAVVNPNRQDQDSPCTDLAAVGVTFLLLVAANRELRRHGLAEPDLMGLLDLVALGTVCDVVPLRGLNRAFVRQGLRVMAKGENTGLASLSREAKAPELLEAWHLGFLLGPRINAGGRIDRADLGVRLLTETNAGEAGAIAARLDQLNAKRRQIEREILDLADRSVRAQLDEDAPVLVASGDGWHPGVIGIVASRLVERYDRPVFVIGFDTDGIGKGSARSVPGVDLGQAVIAARQAGILLKGGGHPMAAGVTVEAARLDEFRRHLLDRMPVRTASSGQRRPVELDASVAIGACRRELATAFQQLQPFGQGNEEPRLHLVDARIASARPVGTGHLAVRIEGRDGGRVAGIAFRALERPLGDLLRSADRPMQLAGTLKLDRYQGDERICFHIDDAAA
ncbi:single-stranded-DNA-specific exonuclease RecJ [Geminicoccus harenae]|uniref:single-stranded-DNA-specific exonuclease RecJ n=2 Tax=Geminicoccus harenae TaxID=2498453 RepID=UPI0021025912|nr:single-stranded-DNA-specific exonuclease RecJ [Geminicoccus harenae]